MLAPIHFLLALAIAPWPPSEEASAPDAVASYRLDAYLDADSHEVHGSGTILFRNPSPLPTSELYFHLYLNAFESEESLFLRAARSRSGVRLGRSGSIEVLSLRSHAFPDLDLWTGADAHSPGDPKDRTDIRVPLPRPLKAFESLSLQVKFIAKLPELVERTGYEDSFHFVGQWFPKLAKREYDGTWAHFAFHPFGEFYADFGEYEVTLNVPSKYVVGSTGQLSLLREAGRRKIYRAKASGVHDFAWTAWPGFEVEERELWGIQVRMLAPQHTPELRRVTWDTLRSALPHFAQAYGTYPHPVLTVVQPPQNAYRSGGMEYPQLITTSGTELLARTGIRAQELVTAHELAHQWFQGLLATNEMAFPFLDEGLTSYAEWRYLENKFHAASLIQFPGLSISRTAAGRFAHFLHPGTQPISLAAPEFKSFQALGSLVYSRSALCLETLSRVYPNNQLQEALLAYAQKWRFSHPRPEDFFDSLSEVLGEKARVQAERMFHTRATIDLSVESLTTERDADGFRSLIKIHKQGSLELPFAVVITLMDGSHRTHHLSGSQEYSLVSLVHDSKVSSIWIDPERKILLDPNLLNNRFFTPKPLQRAKQAQAAISLASWVFLFSAL